MAIDYPYNFSGYLQVQQWHCPCCANYNKCPTCGKTGYHPSETPWSPWVITHYYPPTVTSTTTTAIYSGEVLD